MKKRIFSIILAIVTMLSALLVNVLAEDSDSFWGSNEQYMETPAIADADEPPAIEDKNEIILPETEEEIEPGIDTPGQIDPLPEVEEETQPGIDDPGQTDPLTETEEIEPGIDDTDISDFEPETLAQVYGDGITVSVTDAPEGTVLSVNTPNAEDYVDAISVASGTDFIELIALDISVKTVNDMPLNTPVNISVKCDDFSELPDETVLYHVNNHVAEPVAYSINKETATITFCSQEFSPFVLVLPAMPLMAPQNDPNSVYFVPVSPYNEYDVQINGVGPIITIYCLQQKDIWPDENVGYVPYSSADDSYKTEDVNLLTADELQILKRIVFAGYPNDSQGILRRNGLDAGTEAAGLLTNAAIWTMMTTWGKAGSSSDQTYADADPIVRELIDYATGTQNIAVPSSSNILIEGSGKLSHVNNQWSTGELMITQPAGYDLHFTLNLPSGATAIDADGRPITTVDDGDPFRIVVDDPDALTSFDVEASAVVSYPTNINFFVTKDVSSRLDPVTMLPKAYQTMLYVEKETMNLSGSLNLTKERVGSISVEKEVSGEGADLNMPFDFTVTLSDTSINGLYGEMIFVNGVATFALKHGESKVAQDLPADIEYEVSESSYPNYEVVKSNETGTIQDGTTKSVNFQNRYKSSSTSVTLSGHKTFNNFPANSDIKPVFTFTLSENGKVINTKTVEKQGDYAFDSITYTEAGTHTYIIDEVEGNQSGVIYDTRTYTVTVTVTDNQQGELVATISGDSTTGTDLNFTNGYKAAPAEVQFSGLKTLEGRTLADKEFSFTLTGADDGISETVKNGADGKISFTKITYTKAGTYAYTVKEEATNEAGVTMDSKIYNITVTVTDDGSGQLKAVIDGDSETGTDLNFVNRYKPGRPNNPETPQTGDNSNIILWFALLFVSGSILVVAALYGKKGKDKDN